MMKLRGILFLVLFSQGTVRATKDGLAPRRHALRGANEDESGGGPQAEEIFALLSRITQEVGSLVVPTASPTPNPTPSLTPACTGSENASPFRTSALLDLEGPPNFADEASIEILQEVLKNAYNQVAMCDQTGAFIRVDKVEIVEDAVNSFGGGSDVVYTASRPFTWQVIFEGECNGCDGNDGPGLFKAEQTTGNDAQEEEEEECKCEFPQVSAYVLACNELLAESTSPSVSAFSVSDCNVLVGGMGPGTGFTTYTSQVTVAGTRGSGALTPFALSLLGKAFRDTYNWRNALNFEVCDTAGRIITEVVPSVVPPPDGSSVPPMSPFSIVFNIVGSCQQCGQASVLFGNHGGTRRNLQDDEDDLTNLCPAEADFRCPTEQEFQEALEDTLDRLRESGDLDIIDSVTDVTQDVEPTPAPTACTESPTVSSEIDLTTWTATDGNGSWNVGSDRQSVLQTVNGGPAFFCSDFTAFDNDLGGQITVETTLDDDIIGFAFGDVANSSDFVLVDWKQASQTIFFNIPGCAATAIGRVGLAASRVSGGTVSSMEFWDKQDRDCPNDPGKIEEIARGITLSDAGWVNRTLYTFRFIYTSTRLQVFIDDQLEIDITGNFPDGSFCFYNYSQSSVRYSGLTRSSTKPDECGGETTRN